MAKNQLSRREFVLAVSAFVGSLMGIAIGMPAVGYLIAPALKVGESEGWVPLGQVDQIPVGVPTLLNFTRTKINGWEKTVSTHGVYVYINEDNQVLALSNVCTHLACRVNWNEETQIYFCPCHAAAFDIMGNVLDGPPPRPLDAYPVKVDEDGMLLVYYGENLEEDSA